MAIQCITQMKELHTPAHYRRGEAEEEDSDGHQAVADSLENVVRLVVVQIDSMDALPLGHHLMMIVAQRRRQVLFVSSSCDMMLLHALARAAHHA